VEDSDWQKVARALGPLSEAPIYIDDTPGLSCRGNKGKNAEDSSWKKIWAWLS